MGQTPTNFKKKSNFLSSGTKKTLRGIILEVSTSWENKSPESLFNCLWLALLSGYCIAGLKIGDINLLFNFAL